MRNIARLLTLVCMVLLTIHLQAQTKLFNFPKKNCTVIEILDSVKSSMNIHHVNAYLLLENAKKIPGPIKNATIIRVLEICSKNQFYTLELEDGVIIVKPRLINYY